MLTADSISEDIVRWIGNRTILSTGTREELRTLITEKFSAVAPRAQSSLNFDSDREALKGQAEAILKLLKSRRSSGALNHELVEHGLNYRARVSELRQQGYRINCTRVGPGRTFRYVLSPTDW